VSQIDLVPTVLDMVGEAAPPELQGYSLRPVLEGPREPRESNVFIEWNVREPEGGAPESPENAWETTADFVRSVVTPDGLKFNQSALGEHELYDLTKDPGETTNLVAAEHMRPLIQRLTDHIRRWQERTGDG
jgi:arylsulfatase A-like enzyme